jgi:hypothetical protein
VSARAKPKRHMRNPSVAGKPICGQIGMALRFARPGKDHRITCESCLREMLWQEREFPVNYDPKGFNIPDGLPEVEGIFGLHFHQVAICTNDIGRSIDVLSTLGFSTWSRDEATLVGTYAGKPCTMEAQMAFNYQVLNGKELEFVRYFGHPEPRFGGKLRSGNGGPFISHISAYVDDIAVACGRVADERGMVPIHRFNTSAHKNPQVVGKKFFREAIFNSYEDFGFNIKLIEKVML